MNQESLQKLIKVCLKKQLNFVVFSVPNTSSFEIIIENHLLCNHNKSHFIFHPFEVTENYPLIKISSDYKISDSLIDDHFIDTIKNIPSNKSSKKEPEIYEESRINYIQKLNSELSNLKKSELSKFIYSRVKTVENTSDLDLAKYLFSLNKNQESAFTYLLSHHESGVWLGASPETLLNWKGERIATMSLAGTQKNNGELPEWANKEIEEQEYVTNYIEKAFQESKIEYKKGKLETVNAGPVFHLKTLISSIKNINYTQAKSLTNKLHPTPAVCGVPLQLAKEKIKEAESYDRAYYTGYLGIVSPDNELNLFVNLRCMQVFRNHMTLYLGGGITKDSIAEKEWDETNLKAETLLRGLL